MARPATAAVQTSKSHDCLAAWCLLRGHPITLMRRKPVRRRAKHPRVCVGFTFRERFHQHVMDASPHHFGPQNLIGRRRRHDNHACPRIIVHNATQYVAPICVFEGRSVTTVSSGAGSEAAPELPSIAAPTATPHQSLSEPLQDGIAAPDRTSSAIGSFARHSPLSLFMVFPKYSLLLSQSS